MTGKLELVWPLGGRMNRRGSIAIGIFVLLVLLVLGITLFNFLTNNGEVEETIANSGFLESVYFKEDQVKFYLNLAGEDALIGAYEEEKVNREVFVEKFEEGFKSNINSLKFDDPTLNRFKRTILDDKFSVEFDGSVLGLEISEEFNIVGGVTIKEKERIWVWYIIPTYSVEKIRQDIGVLYRPDLKASFKLEDFGLGEIR